MPKSLGYWYSSSLNSEPRTLFSWYRAPKFEDSATSRVLFPYRGWNNLKRGLQRLTCGVDKFNRLINPDWYMSSSTVAKKRPKHEAPCVVIGDHSDAQSQLSIFQTLLRLLECDLIRYNHQFLQILQDSWNAYFPYFGDGSRARGSSCASLGERSCASNRRIANVNLPPSNTTLPAPAHHPWPLLMKFVIYVGPRPLS